MRSAQDAIESATAMLSRRRSEASRTMRHADSGRPVAWGNPAVGVRNPLSPPMEIHHPATAAA